MKPETTNAASAIRILTTASCSSLSGKSKLTYHVGGTPDSEIWFCVFANSGTGFFSQEWISLKSIRQAFAKAPSENAITSFLLYPLFQGKSINTPAFLLAALKSEGLVRPSTTKRRCHECVDDAKFGAVVKALLAEGGRSKAEEVATKGGEKAAKTSGKKQSPKGKASVPSKVETKPAPKQGGKEVVAKGNVVA